MSIIYAFPYLDRIFVKSHAGREWMRGAAKRGEEIWRKGQVWVVYGYFDLAAYGVALIVEKSAMPVRLGDTVSVPAELAGGS